MSADTIEHLTTLVFGVAMPVVVGTIMISVRRAFRGVDKTAQLATDVQTIRVTVQSIEARVERIERRQDALTNPGV